MIQDKYIFTLEIAVRDYELDSEGIVNNAIYLHYLEHTRHAFVKDKDINICFQSKDAIERVAGKMASGRVVGFYKHYPKKQLWIERKGPRFIFYQDIFRKGDGAAVVSAVVTIVCMEKDGRINRGDDLAAQISKYLEQQ